MDRASASYPHGTKGPRIKSSFDLIKIKKISDGADLEKNINIFNEYKLKF